MTTRRKKEQRFKVRPAGANRYRVAWRTRHGGPVQRAIVSHAAAVAMRSAWHDGKDAWSALAAAYAQPAPAPTPEPDAAPEAPQASPEPRQAAIGELVRLVAAEPTIDVDAIVQLAGDEIQAPRVLALLAALSRQVITLPALLDYADRLAAKHEHGPDADPFVRAARARAAKLSPERRQEIARRAAAKRWAPKAEPAPAAADASTPAEAPTGV